MGAPFGIFNYDWSVTRRTQADTGRFDDPRDWTITEWAVLIMLAIATTLLCLCMLQGLFCLKWPEKVSHEPVGTSSTRSPKPNEPSVLSKNQSSREFGSSRQERNQSRAPPRKEGDHLLVSSWEKLMRRTLFFGLIHATACGGVYCIFMAQINFNRASVSNVLCLCFYAMLTVQLSVGFWVAMFGFFVKLCCRDPLKAACPILNAPVQTKLERKVAILLPVYNEDVRRVLSGLEASMTSLCKACEATGEDVPVRRFDWHVLSDTRVPETAEVEAETFADYSRFCLAERGVKVFYRRREQNTNKKVGNIAEFLERAGDCYDYMIVLDADSLMSGDTMIKMARTMAANNQVGIIQAQVVPVRQSSAFGRIFQFSATMLGEMLVQGYSWVMLDAGTYIGHNAIIRIHAFRRSAELPILPGKAPLGGHILSHDHCEAAMMRRAGWEVWFLPSGDGSYEEIPTNLIDFAARDFRWLTGELQHLKLLLMPGLPPMSRYQLTFAATHYLGGIAWIALTLIGSQSLADCEWGNVTCAQQTRADKLFLFGAFSLTAMLLFGSRIMIVVLCLCGKSHAPGGILRCILSMLIEILFTTCLAPIFSMITLWSTIKILRGQGSGWDAQDRQGAVISWLMIINKLGGYAIVSAIIPLLYFFAHAYSAALVCLPFFASIVIAVPIAKYTSAPKGGSGDWLRKMKLFMSPYEGHNVPETDLDGCEQRLMVAMKQFEDQGAARLIIAPSEDSLNADSITKLSHLASGSINPTSRVHALSRKISSWKTVGEISVGMRRNRLVSAEQEERELAQAVLGHVLPKNSAELEFKIEIEPLLLASSTVSQAPPAAKPPEYTEQTRGSSSNWERV